MAAEVRFEVRFANGEVETAGTQWGAQHVVARRLAFDADPTRPVAVLPAEIWRLDPSRFGGRVYVETIYTAADLTATG